MPRSVADATAAASAYLAAARNSDAGWGYRRGDVSTVEASAAALLALGSVAVDASDSARWLLAAQNEDGGWGIAADDDESGWHTGWAVLALAERPEAGERRDAGLAWLLATQSLQLRAPDDPDRRDPILDIDVSLRAWPWLHDQAAWVEPTALAVLALSRCGVGPGNARVDEAIRYLLDRRCQDGGWNFGNPTMYVPLPPRSQPTAWAMMALQAYSAGSVAAADLGALRTQNEGDGGAMSAALTVLCLHRVGEQADGENDGLLAGQNGDGSWEGSCYCTALALLALAGGVL